METIRILGEQARAAARIAAQLGVTRKNAALSAIADALLERTAYILAENEKDLAAARAGGMSESLLDRLTLTRARVEAMASGVREVAALPDPVGEVTGMKVMPNGLRVGKKRVPLGVVGIIFEARPNVTVDAAALCLKAGCVSILRGGKEAVRSNTALAGVMRAALASIGLPEALIGFVEDPSRDSANAMMRANGLIDVLIPRGGAGLIRAVVENATVPVIETGVGNCHIYVEKTADLEMGAQILYNAKCSRPSVCNAAESLLVDRAVAETFLPMAARLLAEKNVRLLGCEETRRILGPDVLLATEEDYAAEFLDYVLSIKVVEGFDEACGHIARYSTHHSEAIVTSDYFLAQRFLDEVDSAAVYVNASTRFTDGNEFGLGAEIGISTQKLHARGPMGLEALTSIKYVVYGNGQVR